MAIDDMMSFRLAYLQAIARSFEQPDFLEEMFEAGDDGLLFLASQFPNVPPPDWSIRVRFAPDTLPGNGYRPELTGTWIGPPAELTLRFPPAPPVGVQAAALAAYYAVLPTPLGVTPPVAQRSRFEEIEMLSEKDVMDQDTGKRVVRALKFLSSQGTSAGSGGAGMGQASDAYVLGGVAVRALALSWASREFADQLFGRTKDPRPVLETLENWLGYNCPWNVKLLVEEVPGMFDGKDWTPVPLNRLKFFVPNAPKDSKQFAIALAAYNQTGDAYPFTCP